MLLKKMHVTLLSLLLIALLAACGSGEATLRVTIRPRTIREPTRISRPAMTGLLLQKAQPLPC